MKKNLKKLTIKKETIEKLDASQAKIAGGQPMTPWTCAVDANGK